MSFPNKIPGLRGITAVYTLFAFIWIAWEGSPVGAAGMGIATTAVLLAYTAQFVLGGRSVSARQWWGITAVCGLSFGLISGLLTLLFMVLKTGLHGHGPEFTPQDINWIIRQIPLWTSAGVIAGLGLGLLTARKP